MPALIITGMHTDARPDTPPSKLFAKIVLPVPVETHFTYEVPAEFSDGVIIGSRVEVPFGKRILSGIVVELAHRSDVPYTKPIRNVYDTYLSTELLDLAKWMASYYGCALGESVQAVLPPSVKKGRRPQRLAGVIGVRSSYSNAAALEASLKRAPQQLRLAMEILRSGGRVRVNTIRDEWGHPAGRVQALIDKRILKRLPEESHSPLDSIDSPVLELSSEQGKALEAIRSAIASRRFTPALLRGVTGSGKTEVYLRAARFALSLGGGCIVLVPEIGLIPQATARYRRVFGDDVAILHSRLTGAERFEARERIVTGRYRLVLGPRSAVFSPVKDLRLIIVDEEQDDSFKQEDKPRYHARHVALMRGKLASATVVLGSATPSAESYHHARSGRYGHLVLSRRVAGTALPRIQLVDMRESPATAGLFSPAVIEKLEWNVRHGHQSIVFLNKRGHARYVQCSTCGWVARCQNCDISLVYHRVRNRLMCHFCGYNKEAVTRCANCGSVKLYFAGVGTQRVELELAGILPGIGILRMDADTTTGKEGHRRVLEKFSTGAYPILIGTQMVAKGHHFPGVNLVGVLNAEESLNYPDFRSAERTFQQLTQVAGRSGRAGVGGEVIVQTFMPEHYVFTHLRNHDYEGFMKEELRAREELRYPPFARIVLARVSSRNPQVLRRVVDRWSVETRKILAARPVDVLGPAPPLIPRLKNRYREQILFKGRISGADKEAIIGRFGRIVSEQRGGKGVELRWDVDPESFF